MVQIKIKAVIGLLFLLTGVIIFVSDFSITGAAIGVNNGTEYVKLLLSISFFFVSIFILTNNNLENRIKFISTIKKNESIHRLAIEATINQNVKRELDHLVLELSKGHMNAGLHGQGHIEGTDIFYLRGRKGGRLYYHRVEGGYEIVGKSSKGKNQSKVIKKLEELYAS